MMGTNIALLSSALLLSTFPLALLKFFGWVWLGAVLSLLAVLGLACVARWLILPYADPDLHRLIIAERASSSAGKNYR